MYFCFIVDIEFIIATFNFSQKRQHCTKNNVFREVYVLTQYVDD